MKKNKTLNSLTFLIGKWKTEVSNASFLHDPKQIIRGKASFKWFGDKSFLVMKSKSTTTKVVGPPKAVAILNLDDTNHQGSMVYYDERGVSRIYQLNIKGNKWKLRRNQIGFSQKFEGIISRDKKTIKATWFAKEKKSWRKDFDIVYYRH
jgi:hypothetical protein